MAVIFLASLLGVMSYGLCVVLVATYFSQGLWVHWVLVAALVALCLWIHHHYQEVKKALQDVDDLFIPKGLQTITTSNDVLQADEPTAVFLVGKSMGAAMHTMLWSQRLFPDHFKNVIFLHVRVLDVLQYDLTEGVVTALLEADKQSLGYFQAFAHRCGWRSRMMCDAATDPVARITDMAKALDREFSQVVFFANQLVFDQDEWLMRCLHNETAMAIQRQLHLCGIYMVVLPMRLRLSLPKPMVDIQ